MSEHYNNLPPYVVADYLRYSAEVVHDAVYPVLAELVLEEAAELTEQDALAAQEAEGFCDEIEDFVAGTYERFEDELAELMNQAPIGEQAERYANFEAAINRAEPDEQEHIRFLLEVATDPAARDKARVHYARQGSVCGVDLPRYTEQPD